MSKSNYAKANTTWTYRGDFKQGDFNPFAVPNEIPYTRLPRKKNCCVDNSNTTWTYQTDFTPETIEGFYASSDTSWTIFGNVTPDNSGTYGTVPLPSK